MAAVESPPVQSEESRVREWRAECLIRAGMTDVTLIRDVAHSSYDIRRACDMLARGCTQELLAEITL